MEAKYAYYLEIADNAFILSHRLSELCSKGPFLEEDLATTNVALDLIGLAESIYNETAKHLDEYNSGDDLAYRREEHEYLNCLLAEQENEDFAFVMVRQFFMDAFHYYFFSELLSSNDEFLRAIGNKSLKEVTYHLKRSSEWMIRFGNGTEVSAGKAQDAINSLWKYTDELFHESSSATCMSSMGVAADIKKVKDAWNQKIAEIFFLADLKKPSEVYYLYGGKNGIHSEKMGYILNDIQFLTNKYPNAVW